MNAKAIISRVWAREVLDSRGNPTVEVDVFCGPGTRGRAIAPSGASTGRHEAVELRDSDPARFAGKGVRRAVRNVREVIGPRLVGLPVTDQALLDRTLCALDGTPSKSVLGGNAILGVSLACAHAASAVLGQPLWKYLSSIRPSDSEKGRGEDPGPRLPLPMVNMISGGLHAGGNLAVQDFMLLPVGARSFSEALEMAAAIYRALGERLRSNGLEGVLVGDEGGFGPHLASNEQAIEVFLDACEQAGCRPGLDAAVALDLASTQFFREGRYRLGPDPERGLCTDEMIDLLRSWTESYPIWSIEDGLAEDDWNGWRKLTAAIGDRIQLIGDDLFVTNPERLARGIKEGAANGVLVKFNQVGTLSETLAVVQQARDAGYRAVISARSGETEDTTIADLAVATGAGEIKIGSVARSERLAKYNQLLRIEEELGSAAFATWKDVGGGR